MKALFLFAVAAAAIAGVSQYTAQPDALAPELQPSVPGLRGLPAARSSTGRGSDSSRLVLEGAARADLRTSEAETFAAELARGLVSSAQPAGAGLSSWERLGPGIGERLSSMDDRERKVNIAFVHFLTRTGLEPASLSDETLAHAFDDLEELLRQRDQELYLIQFTDGPGGSPERIEGDEVHDQSLEVTLRYRELERDLGRRYAILVQGSSESATSGSTASGS